MNSYCQPSGTSRLGLKTWMKAPCWLPPVSPKATSRHYRLRDCPTVWGCLRCPQKCAANLMCPCLLMPRKQESALEPQMHYPRLAFQPMDCLYWIKTIQNLQLSPNFCNTVQRPSMLGPRLTLYMHCEQTQSTPTWHRGKGAFQPLGCSTPNAPFRSISHVFDQIHALVPYSQNIWDQRKPGPSMAKKIHGI